MLMHRRFAARPVTRGNTLGVVIASVSLARFVAVVVATTQHAALYLHGKRRYVRVPRLSEILIQRKVSE
jgi:hypothetical protein